MKIPSSIQDRDALYDRVAQDCLVSQNDRIAFYERMRSYYLWGCDGSSDPATFNKIYPAVDQVSSFIFSAETTRLGIVLGETANDEIEIPKVPALTRRLNSLWSTSNADVLFGQCLRWSMAYGSMLIKLDQTKRRGLIPWPVDPHSFGVYDESKQMLSDQEAFVHCYTETLASLERKLEDHPRRYAILDSVTASQQTTEHDTPRGVQRIVMSSAGMTGYPNGPGQINDALDIQMTYRARTTNDRVRMRELWIWDDDANDWRIVTLASGSIYIYDRPNFWLPGEHPFTQICPAPTYDYFWGNSVVDRLTQLQDLRELRLEQIIELLNRQVKPPTSQRGSWQGIPDETSYAAQVFGASLSTTDPTAEIKSFAPTVPQDTYAEVREIDGMFSEQLGLTNITQGKGEAGVRAKGHAAELAKLGSSRIKNQSNIVEDALDRVATLYLKSMQDYDKTKMKDDNGVEFIAANFTEDAVAKVDAHSNSPIFVEEQGALADELLKVRAIDRAEYIEMKNPPGKQAMLAKLKKIEAAEAAAAKKKEQAEQAALAQKGIHAVK